MSEYKTREVADDVLPVKASTEIDATGELIGKPLKEGHNHVSRTKSGLELMVRAVAGEPLEYVIVDAQGQPIEEIIEIRASNKKKKKTTCWECGTDENGDRHCWKVPCPVIVGPWKPGRVITTGFIFQ